MLPSGHCGMVKIPDRPYAVVVVLIVVVLVAIVEVLFPGVVATVLRRAPIVVGRKTTNKYYKGVSRSNFRHPASLVDGKAHSLYRFSHLTMLAYKSRNPGNSGFYGCAIPCNSVLCIAPSRNLSSDAIHQQTDFGLFADG